MTRAIDAKRGEQEAAPHFSATEVEHFRRDGYVISRGLLDDGLREEMIAATRDGLARLTEPIEFEAERSECDRLHVAHDLLGVLAGVGDDVHLAHPAVGLTDEPCDRHIGQATDLPLHLSEINVVHAVLLRPHDRMSAKE